MKRTASGAPVAAGQPSTSGALQPSTSGAVQPSTSGPAQVCAPSPGNGCAYCGKLFSASRSARRHERICAANPGCNTASQCHICGMTISRKDSLARHMRTCEGTVEHSTGSRCIHCGQQFEHSHHARRHEKSQCSFNPERISFTCTTCQGEFTRKDTLFVHIKTCKGLAPKRRCVDVTSGLQQPGPSTRPQYVASVPDQAQRDLEAQAPDQAQVDLEAGGTGFVEAESAFRRNLKTLVAVNNGATKDICTYLGEMKNNLINRISQEVRENGPVKFNVWLECDYAKPAPFDEGVDKRAFKTKNVPIYEESDIEEAVTECIEKICREEDEYVSKGSGWTLSAVKKIQLRFNKLVPLRVSSYIDLPAVIKNREACINPKNLEDNECFKWAILARYVEGVSPQRVDKRYHDLEGKFDFSGLEFPTPLHQIKIFERNNKEVSVNVYNIDENDKIAPVRVGKEEKQHHFDLLLLSNEDSNSHFCYIKNFSRLVRPQITAHTEKIHVCKRCFTYYHDLPRESGLSGQQCLDAHRKFCNTHAPVRVEMPKADKNGQPPVLEFKNYHHMTKMPIVVYADFEALLVPIPSCQPDPQQSSTQAYQKHEAFSYCIYVKVDTDVIPATLTASLPQEPMLYRGPDDEEKFVEDIVDIGNRVKEIYQTSLPMTPLTAQEYARFAAAQQCCYCNTVFTMENYKVKDHDHFSGKYLGAACNSCNLLRRRPKKLVVYFHNLSYDEKFIIKKLGYDNKEIFIIPHTQEKMITFSKSLGNKFSVQFIDTFRFMARSLASLASYLPADKFKETSKYFTPEEMSLVTRKGIFPYDYVSSWEKLDEPQLPAKEEFYNMLNDSHISDAEYSHAQAVWNKFGCVTLGEYSDVYLKTDVLLLADVFENFRQLCLDTYGLDCSHYVSSPGFTFDAMLKQTQVRLELITDYDMYMFIEAGIRGGVAQVVKRHCKANNVCLTRTYDPSQSSKHILYLDANNLYGWAMSLPLPVRSFRWVGADIDVMSIPDEGRMGYILEVDVEYPSALHEEHKDLPFLPVSQCPPGSRQTKLMTTLEHKENYIIHYRNLKQALQHGLQIKKIHRVLQFEQRAWMKSYIEKNTIMRQHATNDFEKEFFKLANNACFGKLLEQKRKRQRMELVCSEKRLRKVVAKPAFQDRTVLDENLALIKLQHESILFDRPIYAGFSVLDLSKTLMYNFHYDVMKQKYKDNITLAYMDTDSFIYEIKTRNFYQDLADDSALMSVFDTSAYPIGHPCYSPTNKKVVGKFKDECNGVTMEEFVGLRAKLYTYRYGETITKRAKGIQKCVVKNKILFEDFLEVLEEHTTKRAQVRSIRSHQMTLYTECSNKISLSWYDDKRIICDDGIHTLPYGYNG
ncbi:uncharacterized protein LOC134528792 [Bacillus rossius redtenbacheri]|uniref:uncharacterized protein LOC134528792 n=1 Tax=Bacillus rossius redtenbacheri TaxID=93214 RepID=UPI002FDD3137